MLNIHEDITKMGLTLKSMFDKLQKWVWLWNQCLTNMHYSLPFKRKICTFILNFNISNICSCTQKISKMKNVRNALCPSGTANEKSIPHFVTNNTVYAWGLVRNTNLLIWHIIDERFGPACQHLLNLLQIVFFIMIHGVAFTELNHTREFHTVILNHTMLSRFYIIPC